MEKPKNKHRAIVVFALGFASLFSVCAIATVLLIRASAGAEYCPPHTHTGLSLYPCDMQTLKSAGTLATNNQNEMSMSLIEETSIKNIRRAFMRSEKLSAKFYISETTTWGMDETMRPLVIIKAKIKPDLSDVIGATRPAPRIPLLCFTVTLQNAQRTNSFSVVLSALCSKEKYRGYVEDFLRQVQLQLLPQSS